MNGCATDFEVASMVHLKTFTFKKPAGSLAGFNKEEGDASCYGGFFERKIERAPHARPDIVGPTVQMVYVPIRLEVTVSDGFSSIVQSD